MDKTPFSAYFRLASWAMIVVSLLGTLRRSFSGACGGLSGFRFESAVGALRDCQSFGLVAGLAERWNTAFGRAVAPSAGLFIDTAGAVSFRDG